MKRFVNCIALLIWAVFTFKVPVYGQFYTISSYPSYIEMDKNKKHSNTRTVNVKDSLAMAGKDKGSKEKRQERYMGVSLPLKRIKVTSPFGMRKDPFTGIRSMHNGVDLHARGDEVYAMFDGIVKKVGYDKRSGNYITLQHGNFTVSYCHLSEVRIINGTRVRAHDVIGITGNTGRSTGEHLHITCKRNGKCINPQILFRFINDVHDELVLHWNN